MDDEIDIKLCLYGFSGVGCNQLSRVARGLKFSDDSPSVVTWGFGEKHLNINQKNYLVEIWNGPGQKRFEALLKIFLKEAKIVIFVYDITYRESFDSLSEYINIAKEILGNNFYIGAIVGNKIDLIENEKVSEIEARKFAEEVGFKFALVSAKKDINPFIKLLKELVEDFIKGKKEYNKKRKIEEEKKKKLKKRRKKNLKNIKKEWILKGKLL